MPGATKTERITSAPGSDLRQLTIQYNNLAADMAALQQAFVTDNVLGWFGVGANGGTTPLARGSTDTNLANAAVTFTIGGVPASKAAVTAGTALGALGTIPASTWGIIAVDVVAAGTISYVSGAANYTTGYATEAAAIAALPARVTVKARLGYITVLASASTWIAGTDALAGGSAGNPATTTNYYPVAGVLTPTGPSVTGGANGVLIPTVLSIGGTDTSLQSTAFTYNANGLTNIPKAAVTAGTAFGALGTIPQGKWGLIVAYIDAAGTVSFQSAPSNYTTGYAGEADAIADLVNTTVPTGKCRLGYVTIKTASAHAWIAGTDALAGGSSGNPASVTHYFPSAGVTLASGMTAAQIAGRAGTVVSSAQY